jgi:hypothetical protein
MKALVCDTSVTGVLHAVKFGAARNNPTDARYPVDPDALRAGPIFWRASYDGTNAPAPSLLPTERHADERPSLPDGC